MKTKSKKVAKTGAGENGGAHVRPAAAQRRPAKLADADGAPVFKMVPVMEVRPSGTNPRKTFEPEALAELAESIRQHGIQEPLVVMPGLDKQPYDLVCGERRWWAAQLAGLETVPVIVRELSLAQAWEIALLENIQREDLSAVEAAHGYQALLDAGTHTVESLAKALGIKRSTIYAKLRLTKLLPEIQAALEEGRIEASVAELLGRIPVKALALKALNDVLISGVTDDDQPLAMSFRQAKAWLKDYFQSDLKSARFDTAACVECPKRSANCRVDYPELESLDVCTDVACYREKRAEYEEAERERICKKNEEAQARWSKMKGKAAAATDDGNESKEKDREAKYEAKRSKYQEEMAIKEAKLAQATSLAIQHAQNCYSFPKGTDSLPIFFWRRLAKMVLHHLDSCGYKLKESYFSGHGLNSDQGIAALYRYIEEQQSPPNLIGLMVQLLCGLCSHWEEDGGSLNTMLQIWGVSWQNLPEKEEA